jgi:hypothetical protein
MREGGPQTSVVHVCHFLPPFIAAIIPLLSVLRVEHEEYFRTKILLFLQVFLSCPSFDGNH